MPKPTALTLVLIAGPAFSAPACTPRTPEAEANVEARRAATIVQVQPVAPSVTGSGDVSTEVQHADPRDDAGSADSVATPEDDACANPPAPQPSHSCGLEELTGGPPCEWVCRVDGLVPRGAKTKKSYRVIYDARGTKVREVLRIEDYDGPAPIVDPSDMLMRSMHVFTDESTSPPTLELRKGSCVYPRLVRPLPPASGESEAAREVAARAACPPVARYRFVGDTFRKLR